MYVSVLICSVYLKKKQTCENWANPGSANRGTWPNSSWQMSLKSTIVDDQEQMTGMVEGASVCVSSTHGSGVYMGLDPCRMYWVEWNTRKAKPARKSRDDSSPATGRRRKPVHAGQKCNISMIILSIFWESEPFLAAIMQVITATNMFPPHWIKS